MASPIEVNEKVNRDVVLKCAERALSSIRFSLRISILKIINIDIQLMKSD
ncbi:hypothetical protein [Veronia pacifica]|nr:hypothetical protein [Veronia pacifica]